MIHFWAEGPDTPLHVTLSAVLAGPPGGDVERCFDVVKATVARRIARLPALRARVRWTGLGEGPPVWEEVELDLDRHVHLQVLPAATGEPALLRWCAARAVEPLPRDLPLWRLDVVTGLADGRVGLLLVLHHAVADGVAAMQLARELLDDSAATGPLPAHPPPVRWTGTALALDQVRRLAVGLVAGLVHLPASVLALVRVLNSIRVTWRDIAPLAPVTKLGRELGPTRGIAVVRRSLGEVSEIGHARGAKVNDVALAAVAAGLRDRLAAWGDDPDRLTLRVSVPMAVAERAVNEGDITVIPVPLAGDDHTRLLAIAATMRERRARRARGGGASLSLPYVPDFIGRAWVRWLRREGSRRVNLYVTNVPGPRERMRFAGTEILDVLPIPPLVAGVPLGVAIVSYAGTLVVALHGDGTLTDLDRMAAAVDRALTQLGGGGASVPSALA